MQPIATHLDHVPLVLDDCSLQQRIMPRDRLPHRCGVLFPQPAAAFDVSKKKRYRSGG
jgi:hypothetical protein